MAIRPPGINAQLVLCVKEVNANVLRTPLGLGGVASDAGGSAK
jgi:hypothetical protein